MQQHYLQEELYKLIKNDTSIFEFIQEGSLDGIWYWDLEDGESEWMSPKFWELFGYDPSTKEHKASSWQDIIFKGDFQKAKENFDKHLKDPNHPYDQIVRYKHKDGHTVWVRCRGIAIRDERGKPLRMLGAHNDITQQKELEQKYLQKSQALKAILDSSLDGIMAFESLRNSSGEIVDFVWIMSNKKSCEIVNMQEKELLGQRLSKMMPGNFTPLKTLDGKTLFEHYKEVVISGESKVLEFYFEHDNLKEWFENKTVQYGDGFVVTFSTITKQKELQLHLEKRVKQEVSKNEQNQSLLFQQSKLAEMGTMLHMIAHQWRQPLHNVSLLFHNVVLAYEYKKLTPTKLSKITEDFQQQIAHMSQTIDDFKDFFQPSSCKESFNILEVLQQTVSLTHPMMRQFAIEVDIQCEKNMKYFGYKNELKQVLVNLINNAKDSLMQDNKNQKKRIKLVAKKSKNERVIFCEDNGAGIKEENIDTIFTPYFSTKKEKNGTGLGLYMSKVIIQEHMGGTISVQSSQQRTRFTIVLKL